MNTPVHNDIQRELEQRALRNVRGLVDRIEDEDALESRRQRRYLAAIVVGAVVGRRPSRGGPVGRPEATVAGHGDRDGQGPAAAGAALMLRIWGRISSINVQKVVWCADELGLAYERVDAGGTFGVTNTPEYLAMNPNGLVPIIEDDGFVLYESNAIVRYLAAKHARAGLWPDDLRARADVDRWMEWQSTAFTPAMRDAFWQLIRIAADKRDNAAVEKSREASETPRGSSMRTSRSGRYLTPRRASRRPTSSWAAPRTGGSTCR